MLWPGRRPLAVCGLDLRNSFKDTPNFLDSCIRESPRLTV